ncbi:MAG: DUF2490 domain-containing protein [Flavobacteriaceae bacterium]|nr:DUF2490 domain-containing protein [Flavobacteriaceae bacterium]
MRISLLTLLTLILFSIPTQSSAQVDESQYGAWYMYFWNTDFKESKFGLQGDVQYRNWDLGGDLEQLLLRGGVTYQPENTDLLLTLGYGHITTGTFGDSDAKTTESRIYQEALLPGQIGQRIFLKHRFRYEQRFVENQDFRTRYRYNLFVNIPFNQANLDQGAVYLALYNELFINGERSIGEGRSVELFDRNRSYAALGYSIKNNLKVQFGVMRQITDNISKNQLQLSLHHSL